MYSTDVKGESNYKRKFKMFILSKETVVRREKIKYPPLRHVWK
jgi:hypothetical protein